MSKKSDLSPGTPGRAVNFAWVLPLLAVSLVGCGGGGGGSSPPPASSPPPPTVPPPPPPPSESEDPLPPVSSSVIDISSNPRVGVAHWEEGSTSSGGQGQEVAGLACLDVMPEDYHVHTHLSIFLNGESLSVPEDIGIYRFEADNNCYYTIHTHDHSGKLHVEAAAPGTFTLGQFFAVWGQSLTSDDLAGLTGMPVEVFVTDEGVAVRVDEEDWGDIELASHREITIQVGTEIEEIPQYTWNGD